MRAILMTSHRGKALHTDNNNMGKSFIMGIGNYSGGQLYVETRGNVLSFALCLISKQTVAQTSNLLFTCNATHA